VLRRPAIGGRRARDLADLDRPGSPASHDCNAATTDCRARRRRPSDGGWGCSSRAAAASRAASATCRGRRSARPGPPDRGRRGERQHQPGPERRGDVMPSPTARWNRSAYRAMSGAILIPHRTGSHPQELRVKRTVLTLLAALALLAPSRRRPLAAPQFIETQTDNPVTAEPPVSRPAGPTARSARRPLHVQRSGPHAADVLRNARTAQRLRRSVGEGSHGLHGQRQRPPVRPDRRPNIGGTEVWWGTTEERLARRRSHTRSARTSPNTQPYCVARTRSPVASATT